MVGHPSGRTTMSLPPVRIRPASERMMTSRPRSSEPPWRQSTIPFMSSPTPAPWSQRAGKVTVAAHGHVIVSAYDEAAVDAGPDVVLREHGRHVHFAQTLRE
jgi:hypothetical protein